MPFVAIALFAVGSCGEESVVEPKVNAKDTLLKRFTIIGGNILIEKLPAIIESKRVYGPMNYPTDSVASEINFSHTFVQHPDSSTIGSGDTISLVIKQNSSTSSGDYARSYYSSSTYLNSVKLLVDTTAQTISYLEYLYGESQSSGTSSGPWESSSSGSTKSCSFIIGNATYQKTDSSIIIRIPEPGKLSSFRYGSARGSSRTANGGKITDQDTQSINLLQLLPFTSQSVMKIELLYHYR